MENQVESDASVAPDPVWRKSTVDDVVHEWIEKDPDTEDWIAMCGHQIPAAAVGEPGDLTCTACMIEHGRRLADRLESWQHTNLVTQQQDLANESAESDNGDPSSAHDGAVRSTCVRRSCFGCIRQADGRLDALRRGRRSDWRGRRRSPCPVRVR